MLRSKIKLAELPMRPSVVEDPGRPSRRSIQLRDHRSIFTGAIVPVNYWSGSFWQGLTPWVLTSAAFGPLRFFPPRDCELWDLLTYQPRVLRSTTS